MAAMYETKTVSVDELKALTATPPIGAKVTLAVPCTFTVGVKEMKATEYFVVLKHEPQ